MRIHPYPVTPLHGDYLYHADLADAARRRWLEGQESNPPGTTELKLRAIGPLASSLLPKRWATQSPHWDATIEDVDAAALVTPAATQMNGWMGPPWLRTGWFNAALLLEGSIGDAPSRRHVAVVPALGIQAV